MRGTNARRVLVLAAMGAIAAPLGAQELALKRDIPPPPTEVPCRAVPVNNASSTAEAEAESDEEQRARALLDDASRATVLGELTRARALLEEARALDPGVPEIHFELARVSAALDDPESAVEAFCRVVTLDPDGADGREAASRIERLAPRLQDPIPSEARSAFQEGLSRFDADRPAAAAQAFSRALAEMPDWPDARYNRGVSLMRAGSVDGGLADLEAYLALRPDSPERTQIAALLRARAPLEPRYHPAIALAAGTIVPGGGQLYTGRPGTGAVYLVAAAASVGFGALHVRTRIECRSIPGPEGCPQADILERTRTRPFLAPGLAAGAAITLIGAVRAYRHASSRDGSTRSAATSRIAGAPVALDPVMHAGGVGVQATVSVTF